MKLLRRLAIALLSVLVVGVVAVLYGLAEWIWIMAAGFWG